MMVNFKATKGGPLVADEKVIFSNKYHWTNSVLPFARIHKIIDVFQKYISIHAFIFCREIEYKSICRHTYIIHLHINNIDCDCQSDFGQFMISMKDDYKKLS